MKISIIHEEILLERIADMWGSDLSSADLSAEMLRSELAARKTSTRRSLCSRVLTTLGPTITVALEDIKTQLSILEKAGDVTPGPGGKVAAAPLRFVKVGTDRYQIFGTIDYSRLTSVFSQSDITPGQNRFLVPKEEDLRFFKERIDLLGGLSLSSEKWAGLDKIDPAGADWLKALDQRLEQQPDSSGRLNQETVGEWRTYRAKEASQMQSRRWATNNDDKDGRLWRTWHERGWPIYVWTGGNSPNNGGFIRLIGEEATRTMFALDKIADVMIPYEVTEERATTIFKLGGFLPGPEYRFLTTRGRYAGKTGDYFCFHFDQAVWPETAAVLCERVGVPRSQDHEKR